MDIMKGTLSVMASMTGSLSATTTMAGTLSAIPTMTAILYVPEYIGGTPYGGEYEVTPAANQNQTLETANKILTGDITVFKVPYYQTSNEYGDTVYIASEV